MPNKSHTYSCIEVTTPKEGVKCITLNRPESLNSISFAEMEDLETIFQELQFDDQTRVVILTGAGKGFCAGLDLKEVAEFNAEEDHKRRGWHLQKHMAHIIELMRSCPQPIIAAVNGAAAGGGASLAMASDIRICVPKMKFILSYVNIGLSAADMGSSFLLPRLIGVARAAEIMYTGRAVLGEESVQIGLFSRCVEPEKLMETAMEYADSLLEKSEFGLLMTKEALNATMDGTSFYTQIALENRCQNISSNMKTKEYGMMKKHR